MVYASSWHNATALHNRAARMLVDYGTTGSFTWRTYYFIKQPVPDSKKLQTFQKEYLNYLGTIGRSSSTIKAARNISSYILNERPETDAPNIFVSLNSPYRKLSTRSACYGTVARIMGRAQIRTNGERKGINLFRHTVASRMLEQKFPLQLFLQFSAIHVRNPQIDISPRMKNN